MEGGREEEKIGGREGGRKKGLEGGRKVSTLGHQPLNSRHSWLGYLSANCILKSNVDTEISYRGYMYIASSIFNGQSQDCNEPDPFRV